MLAHCRFFWETFATAKARQQSGERYWPQCPPLPRYLCPPTCFALRPGCNQCPPQPQGSQKLCAGRAWMLACRGRPASGLDLGAASCMFLGFQRSTGHGTYRRSVQPFPKSLQAKVEKETKPLETQINFRQPPASALACFTSLDANWQGEWQQICWKVPNQQPLKAKYDAIPCHSALVQTAFFWSSTLGHGWSLQTPGSRPGCLSISLPWSS